MPSSRGAFVTLMIGAGLFLIGVFVYIFLRNYNLDTGVAWLIFALATALLIAGGVWYFLNMEEETKKTE